MAECPHCGYRLKLTDWRQFCPNCRTNMVVYDLQERLMRDADVAEVQHYHFQKKLDNLKASFIGTKLSVVRIVTSLLPVAALFLPLYRGKLYAPFGEFEGSINAINIYNGFSQLTGSFAELSATRGGRLALASVVCLLLSAVLILLHLLLTILACSPHAKQRNTVQAILLVGLPAASIICISLADGGVVSGAPGAGAWLYLALQAVNAGVDLFVTYRGTPVSHKQCYVGGIPIEEYFAMVDSGMSREEIRSEQYARLQAIQDEKMEKIRRDEEKKADKRLRPSGEAEKEDGEEGEA